MAAPGSTPTPAGSAQTTAGSAPACDADAVGTSARRPAGLVGATGSADGPLSAVSATPGALVHPTAAASPLAAVTAAASATAGPLAAGPAQAEWVRRGADRSDAKTATAAPRTPAPPGRAHHRVARAGCTGDKRTRAAAGSAGSAAACDAGACDAGVAGTSSRRPASAFGATGTASPLAAVNAAAAGPAQAKWVRRGADRSDAKTATAAPRTPVPRGHAHHCVAPAGCARHKGTGDNGSRSLSPATGGQDRSARGTSGAAQRRWRAGAGGTVLHR